MLALTPGTGDAAALQLILYRLIQGVGAGFLFANSTAILTDAFPEHQRGLAMGLNQVGGIIGSVLGLIIGGLLAVIDWRLVFVFSIPVGLFGTVWAYWKLRETAKPPQQHPIDWAGNLAFAAGLTLLLVGVTYGIQPYDGSPMGWMSPWVLGAIAVGAALLVLFVGIELRVRAPMFRLELFRIRAFAAGNAAAFLAALARGGLQFMLIIWLQGVWLPLHGYRFEDTPLWAAIYMTPLLAGLVAAGPVCGWIADRIGSRMLTTAGMLLNVAGFIGLTFLPADFNYLWFALLLVVLGVGQGMFAAPNTTAIMNGVPAENRGVASGMRAMFQNTAALASIGLFFSIVIAGLASALPPALSAGLEQNGLPAESAEKVAHVPPTAALFAAFLGYDPMAKLVGEQELNQLSPDVRSHLLGKTFFPHLIAGPFMVGLRIAFYVSAGMCLIAAIASLLRGRRRRALPADGARDTLSGDGRPGAPAGETPVPGSNPPP